MVKNKTYKELYFGLKKQHLQYLRHKEKAGKGCPKHCKYCREWYYETIAQTKKIKNKQIREGLLRLWKTLMLNNCRDFDIICMEFASELK